MTGYPSLASLRQAAQTILNQNPEPAPAGLNITALLYELQLHQIELDLQMNALKETLARAEAGEARFRELFQCAPMGCFSISPEGEILEINRKGLAMLGLTAGAAAGHQLRAFFDTASLPALDISFRPRARRRWKSRRPNPWCSKACSNCPCWSRARPAPVQIFRAGTAASTWP